VASQVSSLPILYGSRESGHAYKAKLALSVLGIAHEYRAVDLRQPHDQRRSDFRDVSPYGEVPVLVDGGVTLAQPNAILIHLARQTRRLGGEGNLDEVTQWLFWEANRIGFSVPNLRHSLVFARDTSEVVVEWLRARALRDLATLDQEVATKPFLLGTELTVADIACCAYLFWPDQAQLDLSQWGNVIKWLQRIRDLPAWGAPDDLLQ
jgi:glutathione S-transferase